jgi:hypothetical protein
LTLVDEVPCRMQASSGSEAVEGRIRGEVSWQVFLPAGTSLENTDVIEVDGVQYDVIPPIADAAAAGHHVEVWVKEHI